MIHQSIRKQILNLPPDQLQNIEAILSSEKVKTITSDIIIIAGVVAMVGALFTFPNLVKIIGPLLQRKYKKPLRSKEQRAKLLRAIYYLKQTGQIKIEDENDGWHIRLTDIGQRKFENVKKEIRFIPKPITWPGTWWLVAADIPTKNHKVGADMFRRKVKELNFYPLQRTLWIHPFDPRRELELVSNQYNIGQFVTVMEIKRLDKQDELTIRNFYKTLNLQF